MSCADRVTTAGTRSYGVLGHPIGHSLSPQMQNAAFAAAGVDGRYLAYDVAPGGLADAFKGLRALGFAGWNVTIPHKVDALALVDMVDPAAEYLGNVNTVSNEGGVLKGFNTDGPGVSMALADAGSGFRGSRVLCIGAGGVARTVVLQALAEGAERVTIVNRGPERARELMGLGVSRGFDPSRIAVEAAMEPGAPATGGLRDAIASSGIIIQTTAAGMHPLTDEMPPVPTDGLREGQCVFELVYRPLVTRFLGEAAQRGCRTIDGATLFVNQGALAFTHWTGLEAPRAVMAGVVRELLECRP